MYHQTDCLLVLRACRGTHQAAPPGHNPPASKEADCRPVNKPASSGEANSSPALPWLARTGLSSCCSFGPDANQRQSQSILSNTWINSCIWAQMTPMNLSVHLPLPLAHFASSEVTPYNFISHKENCRRYHHQRPFSSPNPTNSEPSPAVLGAHYSPSNP